MVRHIVLWNFKSEYNADEVVKELQGLFDGFEKKVPGLISLEVNREYQGYDACLMSVHENRDALAGYQAHPAHQEVRKVVHTYLDTRASCDYDF